MAGKKTKRQPETLPNDEERVRSYVRESRRPALSIPLIVPLVILYQLGIVQSGSATRNIAEVWITRYLSALDVPAATVMNLLVLAALLYGLWELQRGGKLSAGFMAIMLLESVLYALLMFTGVSLVANLVDTTVHRFLVVGVPTRKLLLSLGAGVYEELVFRLLLIGGGGVLLSKLFLWSNFWSTVLLLVVSSLLFAAAHHVGAAGEAFGSFVFIFRTICGLVLGIVFVTRGLGIAVWTHAFYNVLVLIAQ